MGKFTVVDHPVRGAGVSNVELVNRFIAGEDTDKTLVVLTFDGGGMHGLFAARIVQKLEQVAGLEGEIQKHVHAIGGTSVGCLNALALTFSDILKNSDLSAQHLPDFYHNKGKEIFSWSPRVIDPWGILWSRFNNVNLREALVSMFEDTWLSETDRLVMGMTHAKGEDTYALTSLVAKKDERHDYSLVDVALASSAGPGFFPSVKIKARSGDKLEAIDGGVGTNNPTSRLIDRCNQFYTIENKKIIVISIGSMADKPAEFKRYGTGLLKSIKRIRNQITSTLGPIRNHEHDTDVAIIRMNVQALKQPRNTSASKKSNQYREEAADFFIKSDIGKKLINMSANVIKNADTDIKPT